MTAVARPTWVFPLVLLPGLHGTTELLQPLIRALSPARPIVAIDYPSDRFLSYDDLVPFVMARVPPGRFAILGESFSGPIAIEIAAREERVEGLILASSFARFPIPRWAHPAVRRLMELPIPTKHSARFLTGPRASAELVAQLSRLIAALPGELIRSRVGTAIGCDQRTRLAETGCPVLYLAGRRDRLTGKRVLDSITAARPDTQVHRIDAGHMLLETHPVEAAEQIERFLEGCESAGR